MPEQTPNNLAAYCWSIADLLRGDFKQSQYGRVILPFTLLRRLEGVLEDSKQAVLREYAKVQKLGLSESDQEQLLLRATNGLSFFNTSKMDLSKLAELGIKENLESYILSFSKDAREIFEYFNFSEFISQLNDADLLYKVVQKVRSTDLSPKAISHHDMGLTFEELIRRFAEGSNETAGEHFTPRDIVRLTTALVFMQDKGALSTQDVTRTIYDPTAGTGGFLSSAMEYVRELNPAARLFAFGQELNPESYAICKADMLIKGQGVERIKLGNTLSNDQLDAENFDYMLSNPPFGVDWKKIESSIKDENALQGFAGRFGPGLPRVSDGSLLFLLHLISKLRDPGEGGGRIGIILNGSPLFTGSAGSGESEIRRYILEADLLETIVALPMDMFYNTSIATYVWVLSNNKSGQHRGKVQLINGVHLCGKMRKSLGSKRNEMSPDDISTILNSVANFATIVSQAVEKPVAAKTNRGRPAAITKAQAPRTFASKIFATHEFGYRRIAIERPLRKSYQFSDERLAELRFANKALYAPMQWLYATYAKDWSDDASCENYGQLARLDVNIRADMSKLFSELQEKQIGDLLDRKIWLVQKQIFNKAKQLQSVIGTQQYDDMNGYEAFFRAACESQMVSLDVSERKQLANAVSWKNPRAAKVVRRVHSTTKANPIYGLFDLNGETVEYEADRDLRDSENIPLDPTQTVNHLNEVYFTKAVQPHVSDAWIDASKRDEKDQQIGVVGYEIPFNRYFYQYQSPRDLLAIDADLAAVSKDILYLLRELGS